MGSKTVLLRGRKAQITAKIAYMIQENEKREAPFGRRPAFRFPEAV